jgi:hypothetical protein
VAAIIPKRHKLHQRVQQQAWWYTAVAEALKQAGFVAEAMLFLLCGTTDPENWKGSRVCKVNPHHKPIPIFGTCHLFICPECAYRATMRLVDRFLPTFQQLLANRPPYYKFQLITLTTTVSLRDPDVRARYEKLWEEVKRLFDRYLGKDWINKGQGYIAASQFGEETLLLHFHVLFFGPVIDNNKLSALWEKLTGFQITSVKKTRQHQEDLLRILHYNTRLTCLEPADVPLLLNVLKRHHHVRARGVFHGIGNKEHRMPVGCPTCRGETEYWSRQKYERWLQQQVVWTTVPLAHAASEHNYLIMGNKSPPFLPNFGPSSTLGAHF